MAQIQRLRFFHRVVQPRVLADVPESDISLVVAEVMKELTERPRLVEELGKFPKVLQRYLLLEEGQKKRLMEFHQRYDHFLPGQETADCVRFFQANQWYGNFDLAPEGVARRCRYANQLLGLFDFYLEQGEGKFTRGYMLDAASYRGGSTVGLRLVKAVNHPNSRITMEEMVGIVADVRPEIKVYYRAPEERYVKRAEVVELRRK